MLNFEENGYQKITSNVYARRIQDKVIKVTTVIDRSQSGRLSPSARAVVNIIDVQHGEINVEVFRFNDYAKISGEYRIDYSDQILAAINTYINLFVDPVFNEE